MADFSNLINQAYSNIGVATPDVEGQQYWANQLASGALTPENFNRTFLTAASGVTDPTYATNATQAQNLLSAQNLFDTYATNFDPGQTGYNFWAGKINELGLEGAKQQFLNPLDPNAPRISAMQADPDYVSAIAPEEVSRAYQDVLGRAGDTEGSEYWTNQLRSGTLGITGLRNALAQAAIPVATGLEDRLALQRYLGQDIYAPEEYLKGTSGLGYKDIVNYANLNVNDPVKVAQFAAQYGVDPAEILAAKQAVGGQDIPTIQAIEDYLAQGRAGFEPRLQELYKTSFGSPDYLTNFETNRAAYEKNLGLAPGALSSNITSQDLAGKSLESIEKILQESGANRYQEAGRIFNTAQTLYGMSTEEAKALASGLLKGEDVDPKAKGFYDELLKTGMTRELQDKMFMDAAVRAPDSPFFQNNPMLLQAYTPIDIKAAPGAPGQYGYYNDAPILSAKEADKLLGGEVIKGGNNYFGYGGEGQKDDALGWDLRSKYAGSIANGAGIFGVNATNQEISDFDRIENEIAKLGGIKTETDAEGNVRQVVYKDIVDPETGQTVKQPVDVSNLFATQNDESGYNGYDKFKTYQQTKDALAKGAEQLNIDPSQFSSFKSLFDAVNDKSQNLYVVTGRANKWDPEVAEAQGITGVGQDRGGVNHAQVLYQKVGDKLMPVQTLKTFNFDDPNTSRGFFGDIATDIGSIMSIPPIQAALMMAGGLPNLFANLAGVEGGAAALASSLGSSASNALSLGLGDVGTKVLGNALLSGGIGGLTTGLMTGDLSKAGTAALAGGIGGGITAGMPNVIKDFGFNISPGATKIASELVGGTAATAITGQDPGQYAINRLLSAGIGALTDIGAEKAGVPTKGPGNDLFKAMLPIIMSKEVKPNDIIKLSAALNAYKKQG